MKKVLMAAVLFSGLTAMSQERDWDPQGHLKDLSPEQMATLHTKRMTLALDLSEEQQERVNELNLERARSRKKRMEERRMEREEGVMDKATPEQRFERANERLDRQIAHKAQMKTILSEAQYRKWESISMHHERHRNGPHHRGNHGRK